MELFEKTLTQDHKYKGRVVNLRVDTAQLPDGRECIREVVEHNGGVTVCAVNENKEIFLVKQFRYPYGEVVTETPAGKLEIGEDHADAGKRELEEEAGVAADNFVFLGKFYPSPGYCGEIIYLYAATKLRKTHQHLDDGEYLNVETVPLDNVVSKILAGEIPDGKTQAVVLRTAMMIEKGELEF
ncbi:MAG: NUDIX hydrolase [Clostridia bacterium]|nr:NUDIX hydrolase [Clostridia bacterium]